MIHKRSNWKKLVILLAVTSIAVALAGCAPGTPSPTAGTPAATSTPGITIGPAPSLTLPSEPKPVATPPVVGSPGATSTAATAAPGMTPTAVPITGTVQVSGDIGSATPAPSIPGTATGPALVIIFPEDFFNFHTSVADSSIMVTVKVANFNLVDKIGQANAPGEGHIVYYLDARPPTATGASALTATGTYFATTATSVNWINLIPGPYRVGAQLVNNDNTVLSPPVWAMVQTYVTYNIGAPDIQIIAPKMAATLAAGDITIETEIRNFNLIDKEGQPALPGQGHIIYYMDIDPPIDPAQVATTAAGTYASTVQPSYTWKNVTPGVHTFSVQLVENDNTPLGPPIDSPAVDRVTVTVQ